MKSLFSIDKESTHKLNRTYKINLVLIVLMMMLLIYVSNQRLFIRTAKITSHEPSKRDFCELIMDQMIHKKVSNKLLSQGLYEQVVANNYGALILTGNEKIRSIWSDDKRCKIMIKGENLRSFDLYLSESGNYPFFYEVYKISENELYESGV